MTSIFAHPLALPTLTTLIGTGGFTIGIFSFVDPLSAARVYRVPVPLRDAGTSAGSPPDWWYETYVHALGIRNFTAGLSILSLSAYWQLVAVKRTEASRSVRTTLGIVILAGSLVPVADSMVTGVAAGKSKEPDVGRSAALLHALRSTIWIAGGLWCLGSQI